MKVAQGVVSGNARDSAVIQTLPRASADVGSV
jgi:hypothetical protein